METYEPVGLQSFVGGMSVDRKYGTRYQFYYSRHIDFRKNPGQFTVLPGTTEGTAGVVSDLVLNMVKVPSGKCYAIGDSGNIYLINTSGGWSAIGTIGERAGGGITYRADVDHIFITGLTKVARIKNVSTTPQLEPNWFSYGITTDSAAYKIGGGRTYTPPTSINESAENRRIFQSDIEPLVKIGIFVLSKGTGDWTLTLHDDADNMLGTATVTNANLQNNAINLFSFSSPISILVKPNARTYHFHITSTVADGTLATATDNWLGDCDLELYANALVDPVNNLHPMATIINKTVIGNGRYVASYEPLQDSPTTADFKRHEIVLPPGFEVCGFAQKNLMIIIGAEKRSSTGEFQEGALYFWDGVQETYNDWYPVPEGSPEALFSHKNTAWFIAGGSLHRIRGQDEPIKVRTFRNTDSEFSSVADTTHVNPDMMTVRRGILLIGYPSQTTNQSLEHWVHSYGAVSRDFPESFGNSYSISEGVLTNDGSNNLRIGMVRNYGDTLYISWRNNNKYGVDVVNNSSAPASTWQIDSLYFDNLEPYKYQRNGYVIATFDELPANTTVKLKYRLDGTGAWQYSEERTSGTYIKMPIERDSLGAEFGIEGTSGATSVVGRSLYLWIDQLKKSNPVGDNG